MFKCTIYVVHCRYGMLNTIAYKGTVYSMEWYCDRLGKQQALEFFQKSNQKQQAKLLALMTRLGDLGVLRDITKFRNEGDSIYTFKPKPDRYLCFFVTGKRIVITNAFAKKTDKFPKREKNKALKMKQDYEKRVKDGKYYE